MCILTDARNKHTLCMVDDHFVRDAVRWVAILSDGTSVYQDDNRPGVEPYSAWFRLKAYIEETGDFIEHMYLQFRSHRILINTPAAEALYFAKSCFAVMGMRHSEDGVTETDEQSVFHGVVMGELREGRLYLIHWKTPELEPINVEDRPFDPSGKEILIFRRQGA